MSDKSRPQRVALVGATGYVGSRVLTEALERSHSVTAIVRDPARLPSHANLTGVRLDVNDDSRLTDVLSGHNSLISCYNPGGHDPAPHYYKDIVENTRLMIEAARAAGVERVIYVGGVGSLFIKPGLRAVDDPAFFEYLKVPPPGTMRPKGRPQLDIPLAARIAYYLFEREKALDWTFISPAMFLGEYADRTGELSYGQDDVLLNADGSYAKLDVRDLAAAVVDEADGTTHHSRRRVAVASA